jgi:hypothetical protein
MDALSVWLAFFGILWFLGTVWCMVLFARMARRVKRVVELLEDMNRTLAPREHSPKDDPAYRL